MFRPVCFVGLLALASVAAAEEPRFATTAIFPPEPMHNHSSCIVELDNGDLFAVWYNGHGERKSDDVIIQGARLKKGEKNWSPRFTVADTPGYPDCNPAILAAPDRTVWVIWPTILDHRWEGALLKFAVAETEKDLTNPPRWKREGVLHITPVGFEKEMDKALARLKKTAPPGLLALYKGQIEEVEARSKDLLYQRLGWMPRVHATILPSGRWLWPLYCDTYSASIMAISDDQGKTWRASGPIIGFGAIQPSVVRKNDGTLVAYMRENGPTRHIRVSESKDNGETWSEVTDSTLPNPGAGIEAIRLTNGHWVMIYNDQTKGRHTLAVSVSDDEGKTWKWTRRVEDHPSGDGSYHYPSIMQAKDGSIHVSYTHGGRPEGSRIQHATFNEAWILQGGSK